jgi:hypothetical protein
MDRGIIKYIIPLFYGTIAGFVDRFAGQLGVDRDLLMLIIGYIVKKWKPEYAEIGDALMISALTAISLKGGFGLATLFRPATPATTTTTVHVAEAVQW